VFEGWAKRRSLSAIVRPCPNLAKRAMFVSGTELRHAYLSSAMLHYFRKKLANLSENELRVRLEETLKFLALARFCTGPIPISSEIDEIWHYWILQTQQYRQVCCFLPGGEFLHHSSNAYIECFDPEVGSRDNLRSDVLMLATYVANFGPFEHDRFKYWMLARHLIENCGWTLNELNSWLASDSHAPKLREQPLRAV
jgi:hypothetical protein